MKLHNIAANNLRRRKGKMAFVTIGLAVGIATVVTLITLTNSMSQDIGKKMDEFGANILITPQSNDLSMSYGGISLGRVTFDQKEIREEDLRKISEIRNNRNISVVSPKVLGGVTAAGKNVLLVGVDFEKELKMKQWWEIFGSAPKASNEVLLGSQAADSLHVMHGEEVEISGEKFKVSGVLNQTGSQDDSLILMPLKKAQKLLGKEGKISIVEVAALCSGCPIGDMVTQMAEKLPEAKVSAIQQVVESPSDAGSIQEILLRHLGGRRLHRLPHRLRHDDGERQRADHGDRRLPRHRIQEEACHADHPPRGDGVERPCGHSGICRRHGCGEDRSPLHRGGQESGSGVGPAFGCRGCSAGLRRGYRGDTLSRPACGEDGPDGSPSGSIAAHAFCRSRRRASGCSCAA